MHVWSVWHECNLRVRDLYRESEHRTVVSKDMRTHTCRHIGETGGDAENSAGHLRIGDDTCNGRGTV